MPVITVQLGQCGNQLGCSFFSTLSEELSCSDYGHAGVNEFFRPDASSPHYVARSVQIDMEPKVVAGARATAEAQGSWWRYPAKGWLCQQSGSGNNWAQGFHGYGPHVHDAALDLVRREVEQADCMTGFVLLQSMAGGTGAGLGTYVAQALRDEYHSAHIANCCVWPYESGEVIVQPYNTLLTLSHLSDLSDGIILLENEGLHRVCQKLYNIQRPSFGDMNGVAARAMASVFLPSAHRAAGGSGAAATSHSSPPATRQPSPTSAAAARRSQAPGTPSAAPEGSAAASRPVGVLSDVVGHLCCHPAYRMLTLRSVPQMPATSVDFTTFTWAALLKRLRQMQLTGSVLEEGMDWSVNTSSPGVAGAASPSVNRAVAAWLVLRGQAAGEVDVGDFANPSLYARWAVDPLMVSSHTHRFNRCLMSGALLANDRRCLGPVQRMQERAYAMLASRAFVHQYQKYGLEVEDFQSCFAHVEDIVHRYAAL